MTQNKPKGTKRRPKLTQKVTQNEPKRPPKSVNNLNKPKRPEKSQNYPKQVKTIQKET